MNQSMRESERESRERAFHDEKYAAHSGDHVPAHYRFNPTAAFYFALIKDLGSLDGMRVLDLGCGDGWIAVDLASRGALVTGIDISPVAVAETTRRLRERFGNLQPEARVMSAERLQFADREFDVVVGFAILHHLDLGRAISEVHRVLRPGGKAGFAEPLQGNPMLRLYRALTPQYRTADERPLSFSDPDTLARDFTYMHRREHALTEQWALGISSTKLGQRYSSQLFRTSAAVDRRLFTAIPMLRRWAWYTTFVLTR